MDDYKVPSTGKIAKWSMFGVMGIIGVIVLGMIINLAGLGLSFAWLPFYKFGAKIQNTQGTINIVYDAQRCINVDAIYNDLKAQIPAIRDEQIPNAQTALTSFESKLPKDQTKWSMTQQQMDGELQTNVTGLEQQMATLGAQWTSLLARPDTQPCLGTLPTLINLK